LRRVRALRDGGRTRATSADREAGDREDGEDRDPLRLAHDGSSTSPEKADLSKAGSEERGTTAARALNLCRPNGDSAFHGLDEHLRATSIDRRRAPVHGDRDAGSMAWV
jgi:hypothetical protein